MKTNIGRTFNGHMFRRGTSKAIWALFSSVSLHAVLSCSASASPVVIQIITGPTNQTINDPDHELGFPINHLEDLEIHIANPDVPFPTSRDHPDVTPYEGMIRARFNVRLADSGSADVVYQSVDPLLLDDLEVRGPLEPEVPIPGAQEDSFYQFKVEAFEVSMTAISAPPEIKDRATFGFHTLIDFYPLTVANLPPTLSASDLLPLAPFGLNRYQGYSTGVYLDSIAGHTHDDIDMVPKITARGSDVISFAVIPEPTSLSLCVFVVMNFVAARRPSLRPHKSNRA